MSFGEREHQRHSWYLLPIICIISRRVSLSSLECLVIDGPLYLYFATWHVSNHDVFFLMKWNMHTSILHHCLKLWQHTAMDTSGLTLLGAHAPMRLLRLYGSEHRTSRHWKYAASVSSRAWPWLFRTADYAGPPGNTRLRNNAAATGNKEICIEVWYPKSTD